MEDSKNATAELVANLMLDPGFVLVPQDRYEELICAEKERDILSAVLDSGSSYSAGTVMDAIRASRRFPRPIGAVQKESHDAE
nr:MAG TPA: hypothetical protein [Caudoviricetes sp.]